MSAPNPLPRPAGPRFVEPRFKTYATPKPKRRGIKHESAKRKAARLGPAAVAARTEVVLRSTDPMTGKAYCELNPRLLGQHIHHRRRRSQGGEDTPENMLLLAFVSHDQVHAHPDWSRRHGLILGRGDDPAVLVLGCPVTCTTDHRNPPRPFLDAWPNEVHP